MNILDLISGELPSRKENHLLHLLVKLARALRHEIHELKENMMSLTTEVQTLVDAVAAQGVAITDATTELTKVEGMVTDLQKKVADLQAQLGSGQPVDAEDLAAIVSATGTITASIQTLKAAMPQPVDTGPVVSPPTT
jgi:predicted  nucleic acid-binding Zn-ribbon protein